MKKEQQQARYQRRERQERAEDEDGYNVGKREHSRTTVRTRKKIYHHVWEKNVIITVITKKTHFVMKLEHRQFFR